jgi:hypothetical protein
MKQYYHLWLSMALTLSSSYAGFAQCPIAASCTPGLASSPQAAIFGMGIYNVTVNGINNTTPGVADGYQDYSCTVSTTFSPGLSYPVSIDTNPTGNENVRVWIDYDNNGTFDPTGELFFSSDNARQHRGASAVIPATVVQGTMLRMRVAADANIAPLPTPCSTPQYSQTEDYGVLLAANTQPPLPAFTIGTAGACSGTFAFTDQSQRGPTAWRWDFGDGSRSTQQHPTHSMVAASGGSAESCP